MKNSGMIEVSHSRKNFAYIVSGLFMAFVAVSGVFGLIVTQVGSPV